MLPPPGIPSSHRASPTTLLSQTSPPAPFFGAAGAAAPPAGWTASARAASFQPPNPGKEGGVRSVLGAVGGLKPGAAGEFLPWAPGEGSPSRGGYPYPGSPTQGEPLHPLDGVAPRLPGSASMVGLDVSTGVGAVMVGQGTGSVLPWSLLATAALASGGPTRASPLPASTGASPPPPTGQAADGPGPLNEGANLAKPAAAPATAPTTLSGKKRLLEGGEEQGAPGWTGDAPSMTV